MEEKKDDTKRRLFDITIPVAIAELKQELKDFKQEIHSKLDNGITSSLNRMSEKVMGLQCNVHLEKFSGVEDKLTGQDKKINGLYWAFALVIVVGIVLGLWMHQATERKVSMAEGREGYRMSQMIYRDLYKGDKSGL